jgi:hypothetical protein
VTHEIVDEGKSFPWLSPEMAWHGGESESSFRLKNNELLAASEILESFVISSPFCPPWSSDVIYVPDMAAQLLILTSKGTRSGELSAVSGDGN